MAMRQDFGDLLEPGFRKIFNDNFKELPEQFSQVFKVNTSTKQDEKDSAVGGFGLMEIHGESEPLKYEDVAQGYDVTYTHKTFKKGFTVSRELYEDDQYNIIKKKPAELAKSARKTVETYAAAVLNNAFVSTGSYAGGDGLPLCSTKHTSTVQGVAVQSNAAGTGEVFSEANLRTAVMAMRGQKDDKGMKIAVKATTLVIPPALEFLAKTIMSSTLLPGSPNNDINVLKGALDIVVLDYLTSSTAWFLLDKTQAELNFFWRVKPEFKQDESFDTDAALFKARMRFSVGFSDWRGVWGSNGLGTSYTG